MRHINEYIDAKLEEELMLEMSNISTDKTGLPCVVWIQTCLPSNHGRHNIPRLKIWDANISQWIPISIEDDPKVFNNVKHNKNIKPVKDWIKLNKEVLLDYWKGNIETDKVFERIKKI